MNERQRNKNEQINKHSMEYTFKTNQQALLRVRSPGFPSVQHFHSLVHSLSIPLCPMQSCAGPEPIPKGMGINQEFFYLFSIN